MTHKTLTTARHSAGLTQQDIAQKCGVPVRTIQRLEAGQNVASATLFKVMGALDLEVVPARFALWANAELDKQNIGFPAKAEINQTWEGLMK